MSPLLIQAISGRLHVVSGIFRELVHPLKHSQIPWMTMVGEQKILFGQDGRKEVKEILLSWYENDTID